MSVNRSDWKLPGASSQDGFGVACCDLLLVVLLLCLLLLGGLFFGRYLAVAVSGLRLRGCHCSLIHSAPFNFVAVMEQTHSALMVFH